jgi:UDP-2,3-diacylglucosamine hydrolase
VLPAPCYLISDAHLGVVPPAVEQQLLRFLGQLEGRAGSLVINGDLFDFWFEWRTVIPRSGFRVLAQLARLADQGTQVLWIAGNHDCWGGEVLRQDVGLEYHVGDWRGDVAGWHARIDHGDGLRQTEDRRYRALRRVLRHPWSMRAFRWLHPDLASRVALGSSHASRTYRARDGGAGLRAVAEHDLAADRRLELLVFGHSHVATLERMSSGGVYANAGNWMDDTTFLRIEPGMVELRRWNGTSDGECLGVQRREGSSAAVTNEP